MQRKCGEDLAGGKLETRQGCVCLYDTNDPRMTVSGDCLP